MTNGISGDLGPKNVDTSNNNKKTEVPEERDITEELRFKSLFSKSVVADKANRGVAPDGRKIAAEARKKYGEQYNADTDFTKTTRQIVVNKRRAKGSDSIFGR